VVRELDVTFGTLIDWEDGQGELLLRQSLGLAKKRRQRAGFVKRVAKRGVLASGMAVNLIYRVRSNQEEPCSMMTRLTAPQDQNRRVDT
jgi:hypothetical protein